MKRCLFASGVFALVAVTVAADPPSKLGPEWTYDKKERLYFKMMQIKTSRYSGGNTRGYRLDLEHDKVRVTDTDENIATSVNLNETLSLEVRKDRKGTTSKVTATMNGCLHYDLNCDGAWDAWYDPRDGADALYILHDNRWVRVYDIKGSFRGGQCNFAVSYDPKMDYTWNGKVWNAEPTKN